MNNFVWFFVLVLVMQYAQLEQLRFGYIPSLPILFWLTVLSFTFIIKYLWEESFNAKVIKKRLEMVV